MRGQSIQNEYSRSAEAVCVSPCDSSESRYSSTVLGGFFRLVRWLCAASITRPGVRSKRWRMNSSGCCASISNGLSASAGKSSKLHVTIKLAPLRIAAANTCRSSSSGNTSPETRCSYPLTSASGAALHQPPRALELFSGQVRPILQEISHPLLMHISRPFRSEDPGQRQVHQKVPQRRRVQNVRVIEDSERGDDQIPNSWS